MSAVLTKSGASNPSARITVIEPRQGWFSLGIRELWTYRELVGVLAARDVKVRYKQTVLGAAWAVLQPVATMVIFTIFFGRLAGLDQRIGGLPYPVFAFSALVPWHYFVHALGGASNSIIENRGIITKVYFPRLILPIAPLFAGLPDFALSLSALGILMAWYGIVPTAGLLLLPAFVLIAMLTALAVGLWLAALNAHYRDFRYIIPFLLNVWFFASPIAYPSGLIKDPKLHTLYGVNPMSGVIEGFRWALLGKGVPPGSMLLVSTIIVLILLAGGLAFFHKAERNFVDVV